MSVSDNGIFPCHPRAWVERETGPFAHLDGNVVVPRWVCKRELGYTPEVGDEWGWRAVDPGVAGCRIVEQGQIVYALTYHRWKWRAERAAKRFNDKHPRNWGMA